MGVVTMGASTGSTVKPQAGRATHQWLVPLLAVLAAFAITFPYGLRLEPSDPRYLPSAAWTVAYK